jgi:hypothetical protein
MQQNRDVPDMILSIFSLPSENKILELNHNIIIHWKFHSNGQMLHRQHKDEKVDAIEKAGHIYRLIIIFLNLNTLITKKAFRCTCSIKYNTK